MYCLPLRFGVQDAGRVPAQVDGCAASLRARADLLREGGRSPFVIVADHAGNYLPRRLRKLGLGPAELERHIAWDIGVGAVCRLIGDALSAVVIGQNYSRLAIDCNRMPGSRIAFQTIIGSAILEVSDQFIGETFTASDPIAIMADPPSKVMTPSGSMRLRRAGPVGRDVRSTGDHR
jgi:N-formylglutamate amidohydrolase